MTRRRKTWISGYPIPQPTPPCQRCGQPSDPGERICSQCIRDDERDAIHSHAVKGQPHQ